MSKKPPEKMVEFNFSKPEDARKFLRDLRLPDGNRITFVKTASGVHHFDNTTDELICSFAQQIYDDIYVPSEGDCYLEEPMLH